MNDTLQTLCGFGNEHASEALPGALPIGRNSPQRTPYGLYAEHISETAFTAPRHSNRHAWFYRIQPSVVHGPWEPLAHPTLLSAPFNEVATPPDQMRWDPQPAMAGDCDFVDGLRTWAGNGDVFGQTGIGIHFYYANQSMTTRHFSSADGELLVVPRGGELRIRTEMGALDVAPLEIALIPRGVKFRVELHGNTADGYLLENYGAGFRLPELGPIGTKGLANSRDFLAPVAAYEDEAGDYRWVNKFGGKLYQAALRHSPLDVVAWHGSAAPYKYDLRNFMVINTVSFDHPDPSIFTVLTSPSTVSGTANCDFVIFPPRWMVAEDTFRPPWYHRNVMSEFMGLIHGVYDGKAGGFQPGGASLHNCMTPHGPDGPTFEKATKAELKPARIEDTMAFMFESCHIIRPTRTALESSTRQHDYLECWQSIKRNFDASKP